MAGEAAIAEGAAMRVAWEAEAAMRSEAEMVARAAAGEATVPCRVDATAAVC